MANASSFQMYMALLEDHICWTVKQVLVNLNYWNVKILNELIISGISSLT